MLAWLKQKLKKEPEPSRALRLIVLAAMLVPLVALGRVNGNLWPHVALAAVGIGAGHWYSYRYRQNPNPTVRSVLFVAIHLALAWMFIGLALGATVPQAQFAIFAQAITSFDLRDRGNLFNTLIHSLANLYVVATLSRTMELGIYLLLFTGLVLAAFFVAAKEDGLKAARLRPEPLPSGDKQSRSPRRALTLFGASFGAIALLIVFVIFLLTPRFANRPLVPPFTLNIPLRGGTTSEIINPGVPLVQVNGWSDGASDYFYGFDTNLDLRYRGGLSNDIVMYVRSPSRSYWRSHSYDFYDGVSWSQSDKSLTDVRSGVYFELPAPLGSALTQAPVGEPRPDGHRIWQEPRGAPRHLKETFNLDPPAGEEESWRTDQQIVQTFNIIRNQPNLLFAAYRPAEIFITAERISLDQGDGIRLPEPLQAGMTYSIVSYRPDFEPAALRRLPAGPYPPEVTARYLQLPDNISQRTRRLARTLTAPHDNTFDKIQALTDHLRTEYPYNFFPPPHPPGAEVVDTFLFEDQEGICEQYVTALVVMARSLGIPARLTAGYGAGDYNPVTGYYEVRLNDAHSWAEIYFPGQGWVPFDPTPGWIPRPYPTPAQNWLFANNGQLLNQLSGLNIPVGAIVSGGASGLAFLAPFLVGALVLVGLGLLALFLSRRLRQWLAGWAAERYSRLADPDRRRGLILKLYGQALRLLARQNYRPRRAWETPHEYAAALGELPALAHLSRLVAAAAYRPQAPTPESVAQAREALTRLEQEAKQGGGGAK